MKNSTVLAAAMAMGLVFHAQAAETYNYWIGPAEGGVWNDAANWSRGNQTTGPISHYSYWNRVTNQEPVTIKLDANQDLKGLYLNSNVDLTLVGDGEKYIQYFSGGLTGVAGSSLHLKDIVLYERGGSTYPTATFSVPELEIVEGGVVTFAANRNYLAKTTTISSALKGKGTISVASSTSSETIWKFTGDNSDFEGVIDTPSSSSKAVIMFADPASGSAKAKFNLNTETEGTVAVDFPDGGKLQLGELTGACAMTNLNEGSSVVIEIGALNTSFSCGADFGGMNVRKVGTGGLVFSGANAGTFTLAGGTVCLMAGTTLNALSIESGTLDVMAAGFDQTASVTIGALAAETMEDALSAALATGVTLTNNGDGSYTLARAAVARPTSFVWQGGFDGGLWSTPANWRTEGGVRCAEAPSDTDPVVFPAGASVARIAANTQVASVQIDGTLTLTGPSAETYLTCDSYTGNGTLSTGDIRLRSAGGNLTIGCAVFNLMTGKTTDMYLSDTSGTYGAISAKLTGTGILTANYRSIADVGVRFSGDNTEFAGTFEARNQYSGRGGTRMTGASQTSANAVWKFNAGMRNNSDQPIFQDNTSTNYFGAIIGGAQGGYVCPYIEIGNRYDIDSDFTFKGRANSSGVNTYCHVSKVGSAHLVLKMNTFNGTASKHLADLTIKEGTVWSEYVPTTFLKFEGGTLIHNAIAETVEGVETIVSQDPSAVIKYSSGPISFDSNGTNATWAAALDVSNIGGLTKLGAGTLTLSEKPLYTGLTTVEAGKLEVPTGTELSYNAFSDTNLVSGATITNYAYAANTTLVAPATSGSVTYDKPLDISNVTAIDASGVTLTKGQPYVIASATAVTGYTKASLAEITLTLPDGADAAKWVVKVLDVDGKRAALCVAPKAMPFAIIVR